MKKILVICVCILCICSSCFANPIHDVQDDIGVDKFAHVGAGYIISDQLQRNAHCSAFEAFLITSSIAWAKEKWVDDHVDNNDAYATMAGSLFYQVNFLMR